MKRKLFTVLLSLAMMITMMPVMTMTAFAAANTTYHDIGEGSEEAPYEISTLGQLEDLAAAVNGTGDYAGNANSMNGISFKLTADIGTVANPFTTPIGATSETPFNGIFDGDGHTVTINMNMSKVSQDVGLFGFAGLWSAIKNVTTAGRVNVEGINNNFCIGGVCGCLWAGRILNCYNSANISVTTYNTPEGNYYVGGVCGENDGRISNSYNSGNLNCRFTAGDMVGLGGVCGSSLDRESVIENCYSSGTITATGSEAAYCGGICGCNEANIIRCYYDKSICPSLYPVEGDGVTGLITAQMQSAAGSTYSDEGAVLEGKALVDLLNGYENTSTSQYPEGWAKWIIASGEYPSLDNNSLYSKRIDEDNIISSFAETSKVTLSKATARKNGKIKLAFKSLKLSDGTKVTSYQIYRSTNKKFKKNLEKYSIKRTKNTKNYTWTNAKKLKKGTKYYYKVRGRVQLSDGTYVYTKWSTVKTAKCKNTRG